MGGDIHNQYVQVMQPPTLCHPAIQVQCTHVLYCPWESFSPEQICHQTEQEWRVYPLVLSQENRNYHWKVPSVCEAFPHVSSKNSEFQIVQQEGWAFGSSEVISFVTWNDSGLPKGVEAASQEQVRTGPEPGHCFSLRRRGQGVGMGKEKGQFILDAKKAFEVKGNILHQQQWLKDLEASAKEVHNVWALPSLGNSAKPVSILLGPGQQR